MIISQILFILSILPSQFFSLYQFYPQSLELISILVVLLIIPHRLVIRKKNASYMTWATLPLQGAFFDGVRPSSLYKYEPTIDLMLVTQTPTDVQSYKLRAPYIQS